MDASLDAIEAALFAALQALHAAPPTDAAPFRLVARFAGEVSRDKGVDEATVGRAPALLLAHDESRAERIAETSDSIAHTVETHLFRVYVVIDDSRGDDKALKGSLHRPGVLRCAHLVKLALTGLRIPGLYDNETVELVGHRPWLVDGGVQHTHVVWFQARAGLPESIAPTPGVPLVVSGAVQPAETDTDGARLTSSAFDLD